MTEELNEIQEVKDICKQIAQIYKDKMINAEYNPADELYNFTWVTEVNGNMFELYFILPKYWGAAEEGSRGIETGLPGRIAGPPVDAILKWINFKRLVPSTKGKAISTKQMAYAISRNIYKYGTEGKHLLQDTIDSKEFDILVDKLTELISSKLLKDVEKQIENIQF